MKKILLSLLLTTSIGYSEYVLSAPSLTNNKAPNWTGFYVGGNAGYWGSSSDKVSTSGAISYFEPTFVYGSGDVANALAQLGADNHSSIHPYGFIGGAQVGYNYIANQEILLGLNLDFNGLTNSSNNVTFNKTINLVNFDESYTGSISVQQKIDYLGALRARIGYLCSQRFLVYFTGGFAYGKVLLDTAWSAQESLGSATFPGIYSQNNVSKTLTGWTAGGGVEWLFKPNWSTTLEYDYYSLNDLNASATLTQMNNAMTPAVVWASAAVNTNLSLSLWNVRIGLNYHFS